MISYKNQKVKYESQSIITVFLEMSRKIYVYCKNTFISIPFHSRLYEISIYAAFGSHFAVRRVLT